MFNRKLLVLLHVVSGIYSGACVSIALVDIRFVKAMSEGPRAREAFASLLSYMGQMMIPFLLILLFLILSFSVQLAKRKATFCAYIPLFVLLATVMITGVVHIPINQTFMSEQILTNEEVRLLLSKWEFWHWLRTGLSLTLPGLIVWIYRKGLSYKLNPVLT